MSANRLDLITDEQNIVILAESVDLGKVPCGWNDNAAQDISVVPIRNA